MYRGGRRDSGISTSRSRSRSLSSGGRAARLNRFDRISNISSIRGSSSRSYSGSRGSRGFSGQSILGSAASGAAAGGLAAGPVGAVEGAVIGAASELAREAINYMMTPKGMIRRRKFRGISTGKYVGPFKNPKKLKKNNPKSLALSKGYHVTNETYGKVEDPHCAYFVHSTWIPQLIARTISGALLRKLFTKAGHPIYNKDEEITNQDTINSTRWHIRYVIKNNVTNDYAAPVDANIGDDKTLKLLLDTTCAPMVTHLVDLMTNAGDGSGSGRNMPWKLELYQETTVGQKNLAAQIFLYNESITLVANSDVKLQNRSAGAQASEQDQFDLDRVDNVPLVGKRFSFSSGDPRLKAPAKTLFDGFDDKYVNRIQTSGLNLVRAEQFVNEDWKEPPNGNMFSNCTGKSGILLNPGEIKKGHIYYTIKGKLLNVLYKLACRRVWVDSGVEYAYGCLGRSEMYVLEEKVHTDSSNDITVQYERQVTFGCWLKTGKRPAFTTEYTDTARDNVQPAP